MRLWVYVAASAAVYIALMADALIMYPNYYSAMVGMSDSAFKLLALVNFSGSMTILCTKFIAWLLFDGLNQADRQTISGRSLLISSVVIQFWTPLHRQLALNSQAFLVGFLFLLSLTALHWICFNRVKSLQLMDPLALNRRKVYKIVKLGLICTLFFATDIGLCFSTFTYYHSHELTGSFLSCVLVELVTKSVLFSGMYAANLVNMIYLYRNPDEDEWDRSQLVSSIVKLTSSLLGVFSHVYLIKMYSVSIVRIWLLLPYLFYAYADVHAVHKALTAESELNKFTREAEQQDLERDNTCVICREEMELSAPAKHAPKRLNCGHVMHMACLQSWLSRSRSCPTCRQSVYTESSAFHQPATPPAPPPAQLEPVPTDQAEFVEFQRRLFDVAPTPTQPIAPTTQLPETTTELNTQTPGEQETQTAQTAQTEATEATEATDATDATDAAQEGTAQAASEAAREQARASEGAAAYEPSTDPVQGPPAIPAEVETLFRLFPELEKCQSVVCRELDTINSNRKMLWRVLEPGMVTFVSQPEEQGGNGVEFVDMDLLLTYTSLKVPELVTLSKLNLAKQNAVRKVVSTSQPADSATVLHQRYTAHVLVELLKLYAAEQNPPPVQEVNKWPNLVYQLLGGHKGEYHYSLASRPTKHL